MKDYFKFLYLSDILLLDKNSVPDAKIISMSYLDYLIFLAEKEVDVLQKLIVLLYLVLNLDVLDSSLIKIGSNDKGKTIFLIGENIYAAQDFDEIRKIIIEQNLLEAPDEYIQKELRDAMDAGERFRKAVSGNKIVSVEDQMIALSIYTGIKLEEIYNLTARKFIKMMGRMDKLIHYIIYMSASMSGFVEFKDKSALKHWLTEDKKKFNREDMIPYEEVENKVNLSTNK